MKARECPFITVLRCPSSHWHRTIHPEANLNARDILGRPGPGPDSAPGPARGGTAGYGPYGDRRGRLRLAVPSAGARLKPEPRT